MKLLIANGRLIDPANGIDGIKNIAIADGKVLAVEDAGKAIENFTPDRTIDALGLVVSPGFVDLSARLREPGYEHKATLASEMQAAMQGGVTSLVCPPDTDPVLDEPGLVEMLKYRAAALNQAHVYPLGALTVGLKGQALTEMAELTDAGCIGFSQANEPIIDTEVLLRALQYANSFNYSTWLQPEDPYLSKKGMAHSGPVAARLGLSGISYIAETDPFAHHFRTDTCYRRTHPPGTPFFRRGYRTGSSGEKRRFAVTCDVGIHHIHLTEDDIDFFDTNARMTPPLRSRADRLAITEGLLDGTIDAICSDHTPVDDDEKLLPFGEATPGATGLELLLSLTLKWGQSLENDPSNLSKAIAKITSDPAGILGKNCGKLSVGDKADICVFDPSESWTVEASKLASQGKHTPFLGREIPGRVRLTIVEGKVTFER